MEYIKWRGDLTFTASPFNIVDSLIFSRIAYLPFDQIVTTDKIRLKDALKIILSQNSNDSKKFNSHIDYQFSLELINCKRYKNLYLSNFVNIIDEQLELQFSALTIDINKQLSYITFRGTDTNLVSWKEDLNMCYKTTVPAHQKAIDYLNQFQSTFHRQIILGGHSKGGNLAVYANAFCTEEISQKILAVHNFDGPGFHKDIINNENYQLSKHKITLFIPEFAVVGKMLYQDCQIKMIKSTANTVAQHDTFYWNVTSTDFIYMTKQDSKSIKINNTLTQFIETYDVTTRKNMIDLGYQLIKSANITDTRDFYQNKALIFNLFKNYIQLNKTDSKQIRFFFDFFIKSFLFN